MKPNLDKFIVKVVLNGKEEQVNVVTEETTDGISIYKCNLDSRQITELRMDTDRWSQIWGALSEAEVNALGKAIEKVVMI